MHERLRRLRLASVAALALSACAAEAPPNVVMILIDTLRADHLGCYGYTRAASPHIDALAESGTLFENAFAQSSWTGPSVASLFTSAFFWMVLGAASGYFFNKLVSPDSRLEAAPA